MNPRSWTILILGEIKRYKKGNRRDVREMLDIITGRKERTYMRRSV